MSEDFFYENEVKNGFDDGLNEIFGLEEDSKFEEILRFCESDEFESEDDESTNAAKSAFGVNFLFPWQKIVISNILDTEKNLQADEKFCESLDDDEFCRGRQIVLLPTGAGKSMCFLVPSLILSGATLVFYPLLALMSDQKRRMEEAGISCVVFKGNQSEEEREENFEKIKNGAKVILANPEVLQNQKLLERLSKCKISHIAIDEAHCVSEWGETFRPSYLTLGEIIKKLDVKIVTAFTATASSVVLKKIGEILFENHFYLVKSDSDRANIHYSVKYAYAKEKAVLECVAKMRHPMIVFCSTRKRTENMARLIAEIYGSEKSKFYHAGMTKEEKNAVEKWFFDSDDGILSATCAYGMGMDKGNIYSVVHLDAPEHLENFCQEAGRAGRKGDNVHSVLVWSYEDYIRYRKSKIGSRERAMGDFVFEKNCRREFLLNFFEGKKEETVVCSGCDLCDAKKNGKNISFEATDSKIAFDFIKRNRKFLKKDVVSSKLTEIFNKKLFETFKMFIWEDSDTEEILNQLLLERKIKICNGLWKNRFDIVDKNSFFNTVILKIKSTVLKNKKNRRIIRRLLHYFRLIRYFLLVLELEVRKLSS